MSETVKDFLVAEVEAYRKLNVPSYLSEFVQLSLPFFGGWILVNTIIKAAVRILHDA